MLRIIFISVFLFVNLAFQASSEIINDVIIKNNNRVPKGTILTFGNIKLGSNYSEKDLNNVLKNLYETNFFSDIEFEVKDNVLILTVVENKIIQQIIINGIKAKKTSKLLLESIQLKDKSPYIEFLASQDLTLIRNALSAQGYYFAKVVSSIQDNDNDTINLIYDIELGEKALISKIEFTGDKKIKDRKLRNVITSEENRFWKVISKKKYLNPRQVDLDKRLLRNYYLDRGYYKVFVSDSSAKLLDSGKFNLVFNIDAGSIFKINKTEIILPDDYNPKNFEKVTKTLKKLENKKYSFTKLSKVVDQIDQISLSREYEFITAKINEEVVNNNLLNLKIVISETEKKYVEKINIFGNNITHETFIRNSLEIDEGDPFNELLHAKSINNIKSLNIFKKVEAVVEEGSSSESKIITFNVEEKPTGEITAGAGVSSDGTSFGFSVKENNYAGTGVKLVASLDISEDAVKGQFGVTNPNYNYSDKALSANIQSTVTDKLTKNGYKSSKTGFSFGTTFQQYEDLYISPNFSTYVEKLETNSSAIASLKKQEGNYFDTNLGYSITYDKRNRRYRTSEGFVSKFVQNLPLYADDRSILNGYEFSKYNSWGEDLITKISLYTRAVNSLDGSKDVRISERVRIPRDRLRGFESGKVGPKDGNDYVGGNYATALNFSTNLPMILPSVQSADFAFFIDAANVWGVDYSDTVNESNEIRSAAGIGVNWFTPIGPMNFTLAQPITKASSDKTETFQFSIGTTF